MKTTLTLDRDVIERLQQEAAIEKRPLQEIVNLTLRRGLGLMPPPSGEPYRVKPHSSEFVTGIDISHLNQLADELEAGEYRRKLGMK